jgi:serine/threonine protein kinase
VHGDKYSLLFPLAKDGNLNNFLAKERHHTQFITDQSLVNALAALCSAVEHVHNFSQSKLDLQLIGFHHDLRPPNVLVSDDRFILADFGISTLKPAAANSETPFKHGSDDYLAPECEDWDNGFQAGNVHRSADVWSLGCILAEVATYMAWGPQGVEKFRGARQYKVRGWTLRQFHYGPGKPSEAVHSWLIDLERLQSTAVPLLVQVVRQILSLDYLQRPTAKEVTRQLQIIAIYEAANNVDIAFDSIQNKYPSLDTFLEHTRFNAWRRAMDLFSLKNEPKSIQAFIDEAKLPYDEIRETLVRLSTSVKARLEQEPDAQNLDFSNFSYLNDKLQDFLTLEQREKSREYFFIMVMEEPELLSDEMEGGAPSGSLTHEIRMRVKLKYINQILADDRVFSSDRSLKLEPTTVEQLISFGDHHRGRFIDQSGGSRPIWIEWHRYGNHEAKKEIMEKLHARAAQTAQLLAEDKPESFRSLTCCGFFHEPGREAFGMVFEFPDSVANRDLICPLDLRQRIAANADKNIPYPDLDDRFKLASTLVVSLFEFHSVGWLHKNLMTSNILFFPEVSTSSNDVGDANPRNPQYRSEVLRQPFLVGFNHSRPDDPLALTSAPARSDIRHYHHPEYLREGRGYRLEHDYYSLGIILLEIGFWMPLAKITAGWTGSYEERRKRLLERRVPRLRQYMGRDYSEAVRCCLEGDFASVCGNSERGDRSERMDRRELMLQFAQRVIARLKEWHAG